LVSKITDYYKYINIRYSYGCDRLLSTIVNNMKTINNIDYNMIEEAIKLNILQTKYNTISINKNISYLNEVIEGLKSVNFPINRCYYLKPEYNPLYKIN